MRFLYPADMLYLADVDLDYITERDVAARHGIEWSLLDVESAMRGEAEKAVKKVAPADNPVACFTTCIYRGWMLSHENYTKLYHALLHKGLMLINLPKQYVNCHHLPNWYPLMGSMTPTSMWSNGVPDDDFINGAYLRFSDSGAVVKDYVKSRKHDWDTACFIPPGSTPEKFKEVIENFVRLQGPDMTGGVVVRQYEDLAKIPGNYHKMPLSLEYRIWVLYGQVIAVMPYWDNGSYKVEAPDIAQFLPYIEKVRSDFFTMDVAQRTDGQWDVMELGDGQVSGIPIRCDVDLEGFYETFKKVWEAR